LGKAEGEHAKRAASIQAEVKALEKRSQAEDARWDTKKAIGSRAAARAKRAAFIVRDMLYALRRRSARRHLPTKPVLEPNSRNSVLTWPFASKQEVLMGLASYKITLPHPSNTKSFHSTAPSDRTTAGSL
jgi:hypothetical protein